MICSMNLQLFLDIEDAFDQRDLKLLKSLCDKFEKIPSLFLFFQLLYDQQYLEARLIGENLFSEIYTQTKSRELQGFILQWIIACIEVNFDENLRNQWLAKWALVPGWSQFKWCLLLRKYQSALSMYFQSSYREALILFQQMEVESQHLQYERGEERALFHIALIYRNIGLPLKAEVYLNKTKMLAQKRNSRRMLERIQNLDQSLKEKTWSLNPNIKNIEVLLSQKKYRAARKLVLHACRIRRYEKRSWGAESEALYLALVSLAFRNEKRFLKIYNSFQDPIIKERILSLSMDFNLSLPEEIKAELSFLRQSLGIQGYSQGKTAEVFGYQISKIEDPIVTKFLKLIIENETGCDKESLCKQLWNYDYDPVIHDPKIYKLIFKTKKILGIKDAILAVGGFYRMNHKYCY